MATTDQMIASAVHLFANKFSPISLNYGRLNARRSFDLHLDLINSLSVARNTRTPAVANESRVHWCSKLWDEVTRPFKVISGGIIRQ